MTTRPLRICLISREYPPETGFGGIATFTRHLAHGLKELGHDVEVVSLSKDVDKVGSDEGIKVHRVNQEWLGKNLHAFSIFMPYSRYVLLSSTALWKKFLEIHTDKPFDLVDTPELLAEGWVPGVTRILPQVIRLYTPHSKFIKEALHNVTPSFDHQFVAALERVAMLSADVLTSPSLDLKDYVADDLHYNPGQIHIVRNPIDPGQFSPEGERAFDADGRVRVLFVGRLEERKGIRYLIDAIPSIVENHKNVEFIIIGDDTKTGHGQRSVLKELQKKIASDATSSFIRFIDRVPLSSLPAYYRSADICVVPSVYDNSPYTCLEAMSCGKPVVGTAGGGTKEYVIDRECGLIVESRNPQAISAAICKLVEDESLRLAMGDRARKRVMEQFQRKEIARQTVELYEFAIERFRISRRLPVYHKPPDAVLNDAVFMMKAYDKMLYDTLFQMSYRFRLQHWGRLLRQRPKLFTAKLLLKLTAIMSRLTGSRIPSLNKLQTRLSDEIRSRSVEQLLATNRGASTSSMRIKIASGAALAIEEQESEPVPEDNEEAAPTLGSVSESVPLENKVEAAPSK